MARQKDPVRQAVGRIAQAVSTGNVVGELAARQDLAEARLARAIEDAQPALTVAARDRLVSLLQGGGLL